MEDSLATTGKGQRRLAAAEERVSQQMAKPIEESDARPERGVEAVGPDGGLDDLFGEPIQPHRDDGTTPGAYEPAARPVHPVRGERQAAEKSRGPRGLKEMITATGIAAERTSIDDWLGDENVDLRERRPSTTKPCTTKP